MLRSRSLTMMPIEVARVCDIDHRGPALTLDRGDRAVSSERSGAPRPSSVVVCKGFSTMGKRRLDSLLAERGLFPSRSRAAASVMAGEVFVTAGHAGGRAGERRAAKPGELVDPETQVRVLERPAFVSRGGIKLANALLECGLDVRGRHALDVGASTGGFTDCLLQRGADTVIAVDVGYGILDYRLRSDPRVSVLERTNARALTPEMLAAALPSGNGEGGALPDLATIDVSFISLAKVLEPVLACLSRPYDVLAMVKPQFELGRGRVGKGGVVRAVEDRREALLGAGTAALELGATVVGLYSSGLPGPKGNRETFLWLTDPAGSRGSRERSQLERMVREVEP
jgi:23S rRNA (cytidine1920-2'-O)/16S rRNA (cytidine1409-2'-O)-methyltransferase